VTDHQKVGNPEDELVMYIVVRGDLKMGKGKIAAQAGHAVQLVVEDILSRVPHGHERALASRYNKWRNDGITKVAVKVPDLETYDELYRKLEEEEGLTIYGVADQGRTQIEPGSRTCFAVEPLRRGYMQQFVGDLPLL